MTRAADGNEGIDRSTKTKHCAPRLITIIAKKHRERFIALAETKPSQGTLDAKATRAHHSVWQAVWQAIRDDFVDPDADIGGRLSDNVRFEDIDPNIVGQREITSDKLRKMWKRLTKRWNDAKAKCRSGDTEAIMEKCEERDLDTQYLAVALDLHPELAEFSIAELPDGQGREENGRVMPLEDKKSPKRDGRVPMTYLK